MQTEENGIAVEKFVEEEQSDSGDHRVSVTLVVESTREETADLSVSERRPQTAEGDVAVAFRVEHDPDNWSERGSDLVWTRRVDPGERIITGYDAVVQGDDVAIDADREPSVEWVRPVSRAVRAATTTDGGVVSAGDGTDTHRHSDGEADEADDGQDVTLPDGDHATAPDGEEDDDEATPATGESGGTQGEAAPTPPSSTDVRSLLERATGTKTTAHSVFHLRVRTSETASADDAAAIIDGLGNAFYLLGSDPDRSRIPEDFGDGPLDVIVASKLDADVIGAALDDVGTVASHVVTPVDDEVLRELDPTALVFAAGDGGCNGDAAGERFAQLAAETEPDEYEAVAMAAAEQNLGGDPFDTLVSADSRMATDEPDDDVDGDALVDAFVEEIRSKGLPEQHRVALQRALGVGPQPSVEVRLRHLQGRVEELAAYSEALEAFIDEEGTAQTLLEDVQDRLETLERSRTDLDDRVSDLESSMKTTQERNETLAAEVQSNRSALNDVEEDANESMAALREELEELESTVEDNVRWRETITTAFK